MTQYVVSFAPGDDQDMLALELVQRLERYEVVGFHASGSGTPTKNVWFLMDTHTMPATVLLDTPFTVHREAQIARARLILHDMLRIYGEPVPDDDEGSE